MTRDTELAAVGPDAATSPPATPSGGWPLGIRWRDLVVVPLAFGADLMFAGYFTDGLYTRLSGTPASPVLVIAIVAIMALALFWRWRAGLPVLIYVLVITAGLALWLREAQPTICVLVALYAAARHATRRTARLVLALGLIGMAITTAVVVGYDGYQDVKFWQVAFPAGVLTSVVLGVWFSARREQLAAGRAAELSSQMNARAELATRVERERIARELHDILAHSVSAMMMQAAGARAMAQTVTLGQAQDERVQQSILDALSSIENTGSQSMRELHRLLGTSVSSSLGPEASGPSEPPSLADLEDLVRTGRHSGLIVEVHRTGTPGELDPSVGIAAYRTVQESLTNALKHLGRGTVVDIYESWGEDEVQVQVRCRGGNDGLRLNAPRGGHGLRGLRERVDLTGGSFEAGWVGDEFVTTVVLPQSGARSGAREDET
ncbi:sensor histidine kinase [Ornithinimicrobium pratense]|uniref:histidine kinase n=1 Tax=Ornithinimicrobium pratense TaxID=2593973 RepID=A0A5J6V885_9MICO|nr:histidine kinase [Ornithinimicrobium pratense]QFG69787.1 hypothetical protein FY030_14735 [Ornithinimicrobium pratense]